MSKKELVMANEAWELSVEVNGISMVLTGLSNQLNSEECDALTPSALHDALYAVRRHLERIAKDLASIGE